MFLLGRSPITADGSISSSTVPASMLVCCTVWQNPCQVWMYTPEIRRWGLVWACTEPRVVWLFRLLKSLSLNTLGISNADVTIGSKVGYRLREVSFCFKSSSLSWLKKQTWSRCSPQERQFNWLSSKSLIVFSYDSLALYTGTKVCTPNQILLYLFLREVVHLGTDLSRALDHLWLL